MYISNFELTKFCNYQVAKFESYLDLGDYVPLVCQLSGKIRVALGLVEIIVGLGWILKDFAGEAAEQPVENDRQVGLRILVHGVTNLARGTWVLSPYTLMRNLVVFVHDFCLPKLFIYSVGSRKDRLLEHVSFYPTVQSHVKQFFVNLELMDLLEETKRLREAMVFPPLPGAMAGHLAGRICSHFSLPTGQTQAVAHTTESVFGNLQRGVSATLRAVLQVNSPNK